MKKLMDNMENYEFEILFVNDGSKDKTINIIKQLRAEDKKNMLCRFLKKLW